MLNDCGLLPESPVIKTEYGRGEAGVSSLKSPFGKCTMTAQVSFSAYIYLNVQKR